MSKTIRQKKNRAISAISWIMLAIISITLISSVYGQEIKDNLEEDQVIVCINGAVIELSGDICKVYQSDKDNDRLISDIQKDMYNNPNNDTFNMAVID